MQTYLTCFNELNSRVQLSGQFLKRVLTAAVTPDMYRNIWRKHGKIPDTDGDLLHIVWEAAMLEKELARVLVVKKLITRCQKENAKEAAPKDKPEQQAAQAQEKERAPAVTTKGLGLNKNDKFPEQEILGGSFKAMIQDTLEEEFADHRAKEADSARCGSVTGATV